MSTTKIDFPKIFSLTHSIAVAMLERIYRQGMNETELEVTHKLTQYFLEILDHEDDLLQHLRTFNHYEPYAFTHPFLVSLFCNMIARKMGWENTKTLSTLTQASLLIDIGMRELPESVLSRPYEELNADECAIYETHPEHSVKLLAGIKVQPFVQDIILQHHEISGQGFPKGLSRINIYPLAKVVCLSDRFARTLIMEGVTAYDGLKKFAGTNEEVQSHDPDIFRAFLRAFKQEK